MKSNRRQRTLEEREARLAYMLIIPTFAIVFGVTIFPLLYNVYLSFHDVTLGNLGENPPFIGLQNYVEVINDYRFLPALTVTIGYTLAGAILAILAGLAAAVLLNIKFRGRGIARGIFLFPYIAPVVALTIVWSWILQPDYGVANWFLEEAGLISRGLPWLFMKPYAIIMVILFEGWRYFPFAMLLILARLQAIPVDLYEAAEVDGANIIQRFRYVTLPELRYILAVIFLLRFMWNFNKFDDIFLLTGGAAGTRVLTILVYRYFSTLPLMIGKASATAMFLFIFLIIFVPIFVRRVLKW